MGNEITARQPVELFSFNAKYFIDGENSATDLLNDASIFLSSGMEIFLNELESIERALRKEGNESMGQRLWGAYHLLQMAKGTVDAANGRLHAKRED